MTDTGPDRPPPFDLPTQAAIVARLERERYSGPVGEYHNERTVPMGTDPPALWWLDRRNVAALADHMAASGRPADQLARMVAKPWCFDDEWDAYRAAVISTNVPPEVEP